MICLHCGYCCLNSWVVIVDDPEKGIQEDNLLCVESTRCKHLRGSKPGEYNCAIHDYPWYEETPCANHGQIERKDSECRMGRHQLNKLLSK